MDNDAAVITAETSTATESTQENPFASGKLTREMKESWNQGKTFEPKAKAGPATADTSKETASEPNGKSAPAPEAGKKQEPRRKPGAEERIGELTAARNSEKERADRLEKELAEARASKANTAEPPAAKAEPQGLKAPVKPTKPDANAFKTWQEYEAAQAKYETDYEQYLEAKQDYNSQVKAQQDQQRQTAEQRQKVVNAQLDEAKKAYPDWDTVAKPAMTALWGDGKPESGAHPAVKHALGISAVMPHLVYILGGDKELAKFVADSRQDPVKAVMKLGAMEALLIPELEKARSEISSKKDPPAKPAKEQQAQPTREVGNRGTGPSDQAADAVRRSQGKLTSEVKAQWGRKYAARMQG